MVPVLDWTLARFVAWLQENELQLTTWEGQGLQHVRLERPKSSPLGEAYVQGDALTFAAALVQAIEAWEQR